MQRTAMNEGNREESPRFKGEQVAARHVKFDQREGLKDRR